MTRREFSEEEVARYWDQNADLWTDQVRKGWDTYREYFNNPAFLSFIGDLDGKRVLDAGCGEGYNTRIMARRGAQIVGIDLSSKLIQYAQREERRDPLGIRYEVGSFCDLSLFAPSSFDLVVSFMALMDSPDYERAAQEILRVLRETGELAFSITHPCFITKGLGWTDEEENDLTRLTVSGYFDDRHRVDRWRFSKSPADENAEPFAVPTFPRIISDYLNVLIDAGFILRQIAEPRPSEEACRKHAWLQRWRDHAAMFLYVRVAKPSVHDSTTAP
jgi:SAM-dependent methyltransferase